MPARAKSCWRAAPQALGDAELLALLLRTGIQGKERAGNGPGGAGQLWRHGGPAQRLG